MPKPTSRVAPADKKAVQEIIGRALTDKKFMQALQASPAKAVAAYKLRRETVAYIQEGLRLRDALRRAEQDIARKFGEEVAGG